MTKSLFYKQLYQWYEQFHRILPWRETEDPYRIWISEIILQQTRVTQGLEYYLRFIERFPTLEALAAAQEDEVLLYWQGLGYYSRARNIYKGALMLAGKPFPTTFDELQQIPGVGIYTAGAIASFAYNLPYPALDGNVYRVLSRLYDCDIPFDTTQGKKHFHLLAEELLDTTQPRLFNSAIMEFGALFCTPQSPDCEHCPLQTSCMAFDHHTVEYLPIRKPRPQIKDRYFHYTIYLCQEENEQYATLISQRQQKDIWQHLWEFPLQETTVAFEPTSKGIHLTHVLSHQRIHAYFEVCPVKELPSIANTIKVNFNELSNYAFSRLTLRALEQLL